MAPPAPRGFSIPVAPTRGNRMRAIAGEEKSPSHKKPITRVQSWSADADKPLAAANGISCRIQLAEPHVYVYGLNPANRDIAALQFPPAIIRGKLILKVEKPTKLKAVTLNFFGQQRTEWPESFPPNYVEHHDEKRLEYQVLPFFNALLPNEDDGYGAQCSYVIENRGPTTTSLRIDPALSEALTKVMNGSKKRPVLTAREQKTLQKRLPCSSVRSNSFGNEQSSRAPTRRMGSASQTGYKIFPPGVYEYSFEITLDHRCPETMNLPMGSVHWRLESLVERHGTFKTNLRGKQEVLVVRAPQVNAEDQLLEPIDFTQNYDEVLCNTLIQGRAFPIGGKLSVVFTFTPLEKVEVRGVWISIVEDTKYYCRDGLHRKEGTKREVRVFEKQAGQPTPEEYERVDVRFLQGGELSPERRVQARAQAESLRNQVSIATGVAPEPLPEAGDNLLGDLDLGLDHFISQTVMEVDLQLPTCEQMRKSTSKILHPSSSFTSSHVEHFAKFYLRLARLQTDESGVPRKVEFTKGFAVGITILSCLATLDRTTLPIYSDNSNPGAPSQTAECGCPNANTINSSSLATASRNDLLTGFSNIGGSNPSVLPSWPGDNTTPRIRPIQMMRYPSYAPPPFDADQPPPSITSPPPNYDNVVGTPSHDGLTDYFSRMANTYDESQGEDEDEDEDDAESESDTGSESKIRRNTSRNGRVCISNPRSPGPRVRSNSMGLMYRRELVDAMQETQTGSGAIEQPGGSQPEDNTSRV
ncbi:hypothetical protein VC83_07626 [Pseudogymnoascus destructans]|uniref:Arrestin C-terminal-like domain-containing protein n=2 Tax=Pseudogymnoascus destructans TaxID=655981 RepID=L8G4H8_PSED2|nr:uncharacterized protein VC83_07626 [Pseudogymnoascus destructans]ELR07558.1 hypothetical protein GMDG_08473 [Pseudogymnoascus destructans 20631-21]OAF55619.1 hypothetical protein VC83_07626 [Pseudogymnoascus destructans]